MSFLKKIFGGNDDEANKPRVWPQHYVDENDNLSQEELLRQQFVYTRVFKINSEVDAKKHQGQRYIYAAIVPSFSDKDVWRGHYFTYNNGDPVPRESNYANASTADALQLLLEFEKTMIARGNTPLEGSTNNLQEFAATLGMAIGTDQQMKAFKVDLGTPLQKSTVISRAAAESFYTAAATSAATSSWEWFYERYVDSMGLRFADAIAPLQQEPSYPAMATRSADMIKTCNSISAQIEKMFYNKKREFFNYAPKLGGDTAISLAQINNAKANALFKHAYLMTRLVAILRAGAAVLENEKDITESGEINQQKIALLKFARHAAESLMEEQLGMQPQERKAIVDVMLRGKDPRDGVTPLETLFKAFPPAPKPPAPPSTFTGGAGGGPGSAF